MEKMFTNCSNLQSLNLSSFNTDLVENMENMFTNCSKLSSLNVDSFKIDIFHPDKVGGVYYKRIERRADEFGKINGSKC